MNRILRAIINRPPCHRLPPPPPPTPSPIWSRAFLSPPPPSQSSLQYLQPGGPGLAFLLHPGRDLQAKRHAMALLDDGIASYQNALGIVVTEFLCRNSAMPVGRAPITWRWVRAFCAQTLSLRYNHADGAARAWANIAMAILKVETEAISGELASKWALERMSFLWRRPRGPSSWAFGYHLLKIYGSNVGVSVFVFALFSLVVSRGLEIHGTAVPTAAVSTVHGH